MSDRAWRFYIGDMIASAERVLSYTADMSQANSEEQQQLELLQQV